MQRLAICILAFTLLFSAGLAKAEVAHYSFDEGSGTTIHDSSPSANHGSLSSSSLWSSPGYDGTGYCIQLPGYSGTQYASIPHNSLHNFDGMIYLSAWVNPQPSGNALDPVLVKGSSNVPYGLNIYNGKLWFQGNYLTGGTYFEAQSQGTVPYGQWSQVGVAYDQKNVTFYINGHKAGQTPMTIPIVNNSQPMYVGIDYPGFTEKYKGLIDEVVINNTAGMTPPPTEVFVDIKPGSWPNPLNPRSRGVLPVAVCGTEEFDVTSIDPETILLGREGVEAGVSPLRWSQEDVATGFEGDLCDGHALGADGLMDLTLKFSTQELVDVLELDGLAGETLPLLLSGALMGGSSFEGSDCVWVLSTGNGKRKGAVDLGDLVILAGDGSAQPSLAAVPEPATLSLLALGALALIRRRKK